MQNVPFNKSNKRNDYLKITYHNYFTSIPTNNY